MKSDHRRRRLELLGLVVLLAAAGGGLAAVAGGPAFPEGLPRLEQVPRLLAGDTLPLRALAVLLVDFSWIVYAWLVASLALELAVVAAEALASGAAWVRSLRRIVDRLAPPLVRHAVSAAFAVQVLGRGVSAAHAEPLAETEITVMVAAQPTGTEQQQTAVVATIDSPPNYLVRRGDTLWSIAERAYGSGTAYRRLLAANLGRRMVDGQTFTARGVIKPGWQLVVPDAPVAESVDGQRWYTVQAGDTLSSIAAALCGSESRWTELFALNRGTMSANGHGAVTDPNPDVIWPGLRLQLPPLDSPAPADASTAADVSTPAEAPARTESPAEATATTDQELVAAHAASTVPSTELVAEPGHDDQVLPVDALAAATAPTPVPSTPIAEVDDTEILNPLRRTPHALDPIVLQPADLADTEPDGAADDTPSGAEGGVASGPGSPGLPILPVAAAAGGFMAAAGAAALAARRLRSLRRLPQERESDVVVEGGFAAAQLGHDLNRRLDAADFDPVAALVARVQRFLEDYELAARPIAVRSGRSAITLTLAADSAEQVLLVDLAPALAAALAADVETAVSIDQDVVLRIGRQRKTRLPVAPSDPPSTGPRLLPLGVLYDRQTFAATWDTVGHILVASLPGHGADSILTSLVAALTARHSPDELRVWMIARPRSLPSPLFDLPHVHSKVDPEDQVALAQAVQQLRAELDARAMREANIPDLVVVIPELVALGDIGADLELLAAGAVRLGVRFLAATTLPQQVLESPLTGAFATRLVLRMQDEESSVGLLGVADAAFLGGGGRLLLRLESRTPVELYGYQVAPEHLERLARVMRSAYSTGPQTKPPQEDPGSQASAADESPLDELLDRPAETPSDDGPGPSLEPAQATPRAGSALAPVPPPARRAAPPLTIMCFGGPRVLCAGKQVWPRRGGGDAKPWEFLLYLACQPPEGAASDDAVEALWPDDDADNADNAAHRFRQLRYRLRLALGAVPGGPQTDGIFLERGTFKLDPSIVHSDASEFLDLIRHARAAVGSDAIPGLERARELYVGDLLEGPDARRYSWVDERDESGVTLREHFRKQFQIASIQLAELYAENGAHEAAIEVYRELTELDAADERLWRALFRLHAERRDRQALVRAEQRLRQALRELATEDQVLDDVTVYEPSRDLIEEYQRLLDSLVDVDREVAPVR